MNIQVELSEAQVRVILSLCRMNEYQSLMIEALVGGTDLTDHKATAATLKAEMTRALQRHQQLAALEAAAAAQPPPPGLEPTGPRPFDPADVPLS